MAASETVSITLPPDLLTQAEGIAKLEHRTVSELCSEALRQYAVRKFPIDRNSWEELLRYGQEQGKAMGIQSEEDVDRIVGEFRTPAERRSGT